MPVDPDFLAILRCPESHAALVEVGGRLVSVDPKSRRAYRVMDGDIPVLVVDESEVLDERAWADAMRSAGVGPPT